MRFAYRWVTDASHHTQVCGERKIRIGGTSVWAENAPMETLVEKARTYLDAHRGERVTLEQLAGAVGASPFHLQRRFKEAFGVSPRDYQDAHRVEAVKSSLKNGSRVTDALFEAGYGSVSRFYEKPRLGMSAREYRAKGKGQRIGFCSFSSPLGTVLLAATKNGLCSVKLGGEPDRLRRLLAEEFSEADIFETEMQELKQKILSFIEGEGNLVRLPLDIRGTVFQRRVWDELRRIPRGETRTYREIARAVGSPDAVRAVGSACGANPVALVVPCHRAVRTDGGLGGYAWGLSRKKRLLELEKKKA
jgi:AraC family transcriptional regulator, regulatory protein of adaptative response / methylated-DNA-[protein]-cysteine methyltransferase